MKLPKSLYVVYEDEINEVVLITRIEKELDNFLEYRNPEKYQIRLVTDKDNIKCLLEEDLEGERFGDYLLTKYEFEYFSEYIGSLNSTIMYDLDIKIVNNLKYLKLCDEDIDIITKGIEILKDKISKIYEGPTEDDDITDELMVYNLDKLLQKFLIDSM